MFLCLVLWEDGKVGFLCVFLAQISVLEIVNLRVFFLWEIVVCDDRLREKVECEWFAAID